MLIITIFHYGFIYNFVYSFKRSISWFWCFCWDLGGKEGVLVVWQLDTGKKKFLPRIGSPLLYYTDSPDPTLSSVRRIIMHWTKNSSVLNHSLLKQISYFHRFYWTEGLLQISCADNQIHILKMPSMEILKSISGIKVCCNEPTYYLEALII